MSRGRSRLSWLWRAPARALGRVRDMYVRGLTGCARCVPADAAFGYPVFVPSGSMRSNSFGSEWAGAREWGGAADDDLRELIRAASQRRAAEQAREAQAVARSQSMVGLSMARIDEDAPCEEFGGAGMMLYPRSQSCVGGIGGRAGGRIAHCQRKVAALA